MKDGGAVYGSRVTSKSIDEQLEETGQRATFTATQAEFARLMAESARQVQAELRAGLDQAIIGGRSVVVVPDSDDSRMTLQGRMDALRMADDDLIVFGRDKPAGPKPVAGRGTAASVSSRTMKQKPAPSKSAPVAPAKRRYDFGE